MFPSEDFDLATTGTHSLNEPIRLIGFATRLAHFRHDDVRIHAAVHPGRELEITIGVDVGFYADQHVLFSMVEPMARSAGANDALQLLTGWHNVLSDGPVMDPKAEKGRPDWFSPRRLRLRVYSPTREGTLDRSPSRDR